MLGEERSRCRCAFGGGRYDAIGLGPPEISLHYIPKGYSHQLKARPHPARDSLQFLDTYRFWCWKHYM